MINYKKEELGKLERLFLIPPLSILDVKQNRWKKRKAFWKNFGIKSELGRNENLMQLSDLMKRMNQNTTSIFDPVLCECIYLWFSKEGDNVLDCFAGGSVRGIVASKLNRNYMGIELSENQVEHNKLQAIKICKSSLPLWVCDDSKNINKLNKKFNILFSCPPYYNLEKYSDNPKDISNMNYKKFNESYNEIIKKSCELLEDNSFAIFVIGEVREDGKYVGLVPDTIKAFKECGLKYYNEMILLQEPATAAMRAEKYMSTSRKIAKCHQNILVFIKGCPNKATERLENVKLLLNKNTTIYDFGKRVK